MKITIETGKTRKITPERASWNLKFFFCVLGTFGLFFGTINMFGPWWANIVGVLGLAMAGLAFHTAYKEHKDSILK